MKTHPIMLPNHGGEDVQVATLYHHPNGEAVVETTTSIRHINLPAAMSHLRTAWPHAYLAEAVRQDAPAAEDEPTLETLIHHCHTLCSSSFKAQIIVLAELDVIKINAESAGNCVRRRTKILHPPRTAAVIAEAIAWLDAVHTEYTQSATCG